MGSTYLMLNTLTHADTANEPFEDGSELPIEVPKGHQIIQVATRVD